MKTYAIAVGSKLVFSADQAPWETVTFTAANFHDPKAATAEELAKVLNRSASLACYAGDDGVLVLATSSCGDASSLEIDLQHSSAAGALGLQTGGSAVGSGISPAMLVSQAAEPFALPADAEMTIVVDGKSKTVAFEASTAGLRAADAVKVIESKLKGIARARRDGRVVLTSPTVGPQSSLAVEPADPAGEKKDAALALGFVGMSAFSRPVKSTPAQVVCSGVSKRLLLQNLTAVPFEFHFSTGTAVLPARGFLAVRPEDVGHSPLQRMIVQGQVRLTRGD